MRDYHVYIMASPSLTLYIGVTGRRELRTVQHKMKLIPGFTARYNCTRLVYIEHFHDVRVAIAREKQLKGWTRAKKLALIRTKNPALEDLAAEVISEDGKWLN